MWTDQYTPSAGAIHSDRGSIRLNNCVLTNNRGLTDGAIGIQGAGSTTLTLDGCTVTGNIGDAGSATIRANSVGVVVRNCTIANNGGSNGGIWAQAPLGGGSVIIADSVIRDNVGTGLATSGEAVDLQRVTLSGNGGGGVRLVGGRLTATDSTVSGNGFADSQAAGGIYDVGGSLVVTNCTIHGNRGSLVGGLYAELGLNSGLTATITHSTITNNQSTSISNRSAGGIYIHADIPSARFTVGHTIVAGNTAPAEVVPDVFGAFNSRGYNLIGISTGAVIGGTTTGNRAGTSAAPLDPRLGPLQDNGGPTLTRLPLVGGPLLNAGDPAINISSASAFDQRGGGYPRVQFGRIDIGAAEAQTITDTVIRDNFGAGLELQGDVVMQRVTVAGNGGSGVLLRGGRLTLTDSTINGNGNGAFGSPLAGGVYYSGGSVGLTGLTITNTTIDGNRGAFVGGLYVQSSNNAAFTGSIARATITNNQVAGGNARAGGLWINTDVAWPNFTVGNTVIAGNSAPAGFATDVSATFNSLGYNFVGDGTGMLVGGNKAGNQVGTAATPIDPRLGPLQNNGGPTWARVPLPGSPLINAGDPGFSAASSPPFDQRGSGYGRVAFGRIDIGAAEVQPIRVLPVVVNGGAAQRSRVTEVSVTFDSLVALPAAAADAFRLTRSGPGGPAGDVTLTVDLSGSTASQTIAKLTFSGPLTEFRSLVDGDYTLTVFGRQVGGAGGALLDGKGVPGGDSVTSLFRLYGDMNGDRAVNGLDLALFRGAFGTTAGHVNYLAALDADGDGTINGTDLAVFRNRFGATLP